MEQFLSDHWLDILGTLIGLVYVYQEYKASILLWITGVIMPVVYIFVYLNAGLYADMGMQVYYALAAAYGFASWMLGRTHGKEAKEMPITRVSARTAALSVAVFAVAWGATFVILKQWTNSTVPVLDSFGNALSIIGLWWLARKYIEQWIVWIVVDAELAALYVYKDIPFTAGLYALYTVIAVAGYFEWQRMMRAEAVNNETTHRP
jgi:nicotinamide mononucleotide transporter